MGTAALDAFLNPEVQDIILEKMSKLIISKVKKWSCSTNKRLIEEKVLSNPTVKEHIRAEMLSLKLTQAEMDRAFLDVFLKPENLDIIADNRKVKRLQEEAGRA